MGRWATSKREAIIQRLEEISAANGGRLEIDAVINDARHKSSPLHDQFTWDVEEAALKCWRSEARALINMIWERVQEEPVVLAPVWIRDPRAGNSEQGYVETVSLRSERTLAREALAEELARARVAMERAESVAIALGLSRDVKKIHELIVITNDKLTKAA